VHGVNLEPVEASNHGWIVVVEAAGLGLVFNFMEAQFTGLWYHPGNWLLPGPMRR